MNDDELSFEPGDLIFVIGKDDAAWWKGSLKGVRIINLTSLNLGVESNGV